MRRHDDVKALAHYSEALKLNETQTPSMFQIAKIHLRQGDIKKAQHQCVTILRISPEHEDAAMMFGDIMFQKNEYTEATTRFKKLLDMKPENYVALHKLIVLLKRAGKLEDAKKYISATEKSGSRAAHSAGLSYCKGLFLWLSNEPHEGKYRTSQYRIQQFGRLGFLLHYNFFI